MSYKIEQFQGVYRFLSNFWPAEVEYDGVRYPSVEHAYQASKTLDVEARKAIQAAEGPGKAKRLGKGLKLRSDWNRVRTEIMEDLVRQKFQHPHLRDQLLDTEDATLIEGNTWGDTFWGVCKGRGENNLGRILMKVRAEIVAAALGSEDGDSDQD